MALSNAERQKRYRERAAAALRNGPAVSVRSRFGAPAFEDGPYLARGVGVLSVLPFARASWQTKPSSELNINVSLEQRRPRGWGVRSGSHRRGQHAAPPLAAPQGAVNINLLIGADAVQRLTELGWLAPPGRTNRDAVTSAVVRLAANALGLGPTR